MPKTEVFNRDLVLENATNVFHHKGYNGTSMQDLVDATGLNRSSIYNSFNNKLELYLECLKVYNKKYQKATSNILMKSDNALGAIESLFKLYLKESVTDKDNKGCLIGNCKAEMGNQETHITQFLLSNQDDTLDFLEDLVSQGQKDKVINTNRSANEYALFLFTSLQGFRMTGMLLNDKEKLQGIINTIINTIK